MPIRLHRSGRMAGVLAILFFIPPASGAEPLTPGQQRLIELLGYVQVARDRCGYPLDVAVLELTLGRDGITFQEPVELEVRARSIEEAAAAFTGMRTSVECAYAYERFGPDGSEFKGLLKRKPE